MQNVHSHCFDASRHLEPATIRESDISRGFPLDLTTKIETFLDEMAPFEKVAVFGLKARRTGYWVPDQFVADFVANAPDKLVGFAACDPTQPEYLDEMRFAFETLRLRGMKMGPMYAGFDPRDERCAPVYRYCEEHGIPVLFHTGTTFNRLAVLGYSRPWLFDEVAMAYPELRIVLAHVGHPYGEECLVVIRKHPHVYADISALYYRPWQFYNMLITAQEYRVTHKLLFGTDYPFAATQPSIEGLRHCNDVAGPGMPRFSDQEIEEILERDAFSLLGLGG